MSWLFASSGQSIGASASVFPMNFQGWFPLGLGFHDSSVGKESTCNAGDPSLIPGSGRSAGEGIGYPFQYSWASLVAQPVKNPLQCRRPGFNPCVGKIPWRRERLPTPVLWAGEFHGLYSPWGRKESDTTEWLSLHSLRIDWFGPLMKEYIKVVFPHNTILFSHEGNEVLIPAKMWMKLKNIKLNEKAETITSCIMPFILNFQNWWVHLKNKSQRHSHGCQGLIGGENWGLTC